MGVGGVQNISIINKMIVYELKADLFALKISKWKIVLVRSQRSGKFTHILLVMIMPYIMWGSRLPQADDSVSQTEKTVPYSQYCER